MPFDFSTFPIITTERLRLRQLTLDDASEIMSLFGSLEVLRFLNDPPVDTHQKAIDMINWFNKLYDDHECVNWGITLRGDDKLIGMCGSYGWDRSDRHVDIGRNHLELDVASCGFAAQEGPA